MSESNIIWAVYALFLVATIAGFKVMPMRWAAASFYIGGWLILPVARYPGSTITPDYFTVDVIGAALPSNLGLTKAAVVPVAVLLALTLREPGWWRQLKPGWADACMLAFCLFPLAGSVTGATPLAAAAHDLVMLAGIWGASWCIGRVTCADREGVQAWLTAIGGAGVALLPIALAEGIRGPFVYGNVYGAHAFLLEGSMRTFGHRPLGFFEHGNQYGMWMAMASLAWLYLVRAQGSAIRWLAFATTGAAMLAGQSAGAIALFVIGVLMALAPKRAVRAGLLASGALLVLAGPVYLSGLVPVERLAKETALGRKAVATMKSNPRSNTFGYRIRRDQMALRLIYQAPVAGYGRWDWWRPLGSHPWGLPLLIAGQYGLIALLLASVALFGSPVRQLISENPRRAQISALVLLAGVDAFLNSYLFFPAIVAAAGLTQRDWTDASPGEPRAA